MPGLTGIIGAADCRRDRIALMTQCLAQEPSHVAGVCDFDELGVSVGWKVIPKSFSASMPVWNQSRDVCLIFLGENFLSAEEFHACGLEHIDPEAPAAQALISMYELMGIGFLGKLNGWFRGLLIDLRKNYAVLFNDRYGLGRIYYHQAPDGFYFSSEAKSLLAVLPSLKTLDLRGVAEMLTCGCVLQNRTLFQGVSLLPAGSEWSFHNQQLKTQRYFDPQSWEQQTKLGIGEFYDALKESFARVLPKYMAGPNSIGMSLTGGLDSRMIMAWSSQAPGALPCYSFRGPFRDSADVLIGRRVAALCGQPHQVIRVGEDFLKNFAALAEKTVLVSDGAMDVTGAVELYVNQIAQDLAPVRLTGNYGSEILRGNVAFRPKAIAGDVLVDEMSHLVADAAITYQAERNIPLTSFIAFKQTPWHHYARLSVEQSQLTLRSPYLDNEIVKLMYRAPEVMYQDPSISMRLVHDGNPALASLPTDRGVRFPVLPFVSRAHSLLAEFTAKAEYAVDYGLPQSFCRFEQIVRPLHLERLFLGRHKFYHFRTWYREQLSSYLRDILLTQRAKQRPYLRGAALERLVVDHSTGAANWTRELHLLLTLELLQRLLIDQ